MQAAQSTQAPINPDVGLRSRAKRALRSAAIWTWTGLTFLGTFITGFVGAGFISHVATHAAFKAGVEEFLLYLLIGCAYGGAWRIFSVWTASKVYDWSKIQ